MATYVYCKNTGRMVDKATGEPMNQPGSNAPLTAPRVFGDYPGYHSPIDGRWIEGRRARAYDMEKHGCVDGNDFSTGPRKLKNERFAKKRGLEHLLE